MDADRSALNLPSIAPFPDGRIVRDGARLEIQISGDALARELESRLMESILFAAVIDGARVVITEDLVEDGGGPFVQWVRYGLQCTINGRPATMSEVHALLASAGYSQIVVRHAYGASEYLFA